MKILILSISLISMVLSMYCFPQSAMAASNCSPRGACQPKVFFWEQSFPVGHCLLSNPSITLNQGGHGHLSAFVSSSGSSDSLGITFELLGHVGQSVGSIGPFWSPTISNTQWETDFFYPSSFFDPTEGAKIIWWHC
jgi:hypothetical protein